MKNMLLIDGNSLINRAFYALPPLSNDKGQPTQAVYGFTTMLIKAIADFSPEYIAVAFDLPGGTFRNRRYDGYKATRKKMPDELAVQLPILKEELKLMGIAIVEKSDYEADDIIGTLAADESVMTYIITGDRDSFQLISDTTRVVYTKRGISDTDVLDAEKLKAEYGFTPEQVIEFKALRGDSSDNIPGIAGIGDKTALSLIEQYGNIDALYEHIDEQKGKLKDKLIEGKDNAYLSRELATIVRNVPIETTVEDCKFTFPFSSAVRTFFASNRFKTLVKRDELFLEGTLGEVETKKDFTAVDITDEKSLKEYLSGAKEITLVFGDDIYASKKGEENARIVITRSLLDIGFSYTNALNLLKPTLENNSVKKGFYDAKKVLKSLKQSGIIAQNYDDIKLKQYLVDMRVIGETLNETLENAGLSKDFPAAALFMLNIELTKKLGELNMTALYEEIELPLVEVLMRMEERGVCVDEQLLDKLGGKFITEKDELARVIYELAGKRFNINSPRQLAEVLFEDLKIPYPKKGTKHSTSAEILDMIADRHEIIPLCQKWRFLAKLHSTYIEGIRKLLSNGVVHTDFKQTLTQTGRLSSAEPNLQNIPVREEEGKRLRGLFIAREGYTLVSADYSQIELRLLAHLSGDERMIELYRDGADIHAHTASEVFGVPVDKVTDTQRRAAKAVNFGIVYGMSDYGLSQSIKVSVSEARKYMETYFARFPSIKPYLDGVVDNAKKQGFVTTLKGRVRYIPELASANAYTRSFGERAAMNMPLQGSAADIIKIAMCSVSRRLENMKSKLILQIHDELIVEASDDELEEVKFILRECMENAVQLLVPLTADVSVGKSWLEC